MLAGRAAQRHRRPALRLRGLRPAAARGPPLRRGRRHRAGCSTRSRDFRFGDRQLDPAARARRGGRPRPATAWPATGSAATSGATPRARSSSPARRCSRSRAPSPRPCCWRRWSCSILNHDSAIASAAARMAVAAGDRPCIEMGSRRTHEEAAVAAARAAYIAGFATTSNLEAGRQRYGVPTAGTAAHAFTLLHEKEARRVPRPGRRARGRHHPAGRHLRHRRRRSGPRSRSPGPSSARSASTPATCACRPTRCAPSSTSSAPPRPASSSPATSTSTRSPRSRPRRSTRTAWAPRWSPAPAPRPPASSTSSSRSTAVPWPSAREDKVSHGGRKTAIRRHRASGTATEEVVHSQGTPGAPRRGPRPAGAHRPERRAAQRTHPRRVPRTPEAVLTTLPWRGLSLSRGEPAIPTTYEEPHA